MAKTREFFESGKSIWRSVREYIGQGGHKRQVEVSDSVALETFLETRSSHVGQTALYGYIRTRAGSRFPELFENDEFVVAINIAKWQMWIACLSDLSVYSGGLLRRVGNIDADRVDRQISKSVGRILERTGLPEEAGDRFAESRDQLLARLAGVDWDDVGEDDAAFTVSPEALVYWAPIVDELKELDSEIVRNSVRFRWQEVRRDLRNGLQVDRFAED